ncbi:MULTISPECIES: hypothetical protein [unclassified Streptomyces]|uniref:hypothetical protein n=1 Tax=unclassified Streptomyces TaxID=2593676 RepID=UPI000DC7DA87|nr:MULTISPECIES: hypothetical protein [unclassified Streptomyces]AWZ06064.1 hypothetical protein DRB89_17160 [Streptomyces sp. ICC4]AWZ14908.1 hypothetical protein DRB96_24575 [Streptomyces sp. ICC1]
MIGEPEMVEGDWETAGRPGGAVPESEGPRERARGPRTPWRWALGGAVAVSAVWAGALAAQDGLAGAPRIGYRHSADLCKETRFEVLGQAVGQGFEGFQSSEGAHPARDWAYCGADMRYEEGSVMYGAQVLVELHKKGGPGEEFATGPAMDPGTRLDLAERREVAGLGDRAVLDRFYGSGGERLMVLDGAAVFTITVEWYRAAPGEPRDTGAGVDEDAVHAAMIEDVRALMAKLRR